MTETKLTGAQKVIGWLVAVLIALLFVPLAIVTHWSALLWFGAAIVLVLPPIRERAHKAMGSSLAPGARFFLVAALVVCGMIFPQMQESREKERAEEVAAAERRKAEEADRAAEFRSRRPALLEQLAAAEGEEALAAVLSAADTYKAAADLEFQAQADVARQKLKAIRDAARTKELLAELKSVPEREYARNERLYAELAKLHPDNTDYADKLAYYKPKAEAERRENAEKARMAGLWTYTADEDAMTGKVSRFAYIQSRNTVSFDFPYQGAQHGTLVIRDHASHGADVVMRIERGQILCRSYEDCTIRVRFDEGGPLRWRAIGPSDNSSESVFLRNQGDFRARMRRAKLVRIEVPVHDEGNQVFEFEVGGYDEKRYRSQKP